LRKNRTRGRNNVFQQRQKCNRSKDRNAQGGFRLDGGLVAQMTIRASRVIRGIVVIPVADNTCGKDQERDQRQRNPEYANCLPHGHSGGSELGDKPPECYLDVGCK
jgi:hypothetical protein